MRKWPDESAYIALRTTGAPQQIGDGPAVFPQKVAMARNTMDRPSLELLPNI